MVKKILIYSFLILSSSSVISQVCVGTQGQVTWQCWQNLFDDELGELTAEEDYPLNPDYSQIVYKVQSPVNFDNFMGGRIAGFISIPQSDDVTFNVTGDDKVRFYLSTDQNPDNMVLTAYTDDWTNIAEHDKYVEQTSSIVSLQQGVYYYFELIYVEGGGGDHVSLYWKTVVEDPNNWTLINSNYINSVDCLPAACPERGTPCDDNDSTTSDDEEDGFCNCIGKKDTNNSCIGERKFINNYGYDTIPGGDLNDLYTAPNFPALPNRGKRLHYLAEKNQNTIDSTGNLIQAFLTVPVTGSYKFNITGNNECIFFLSSDEDPANKQAHQILVTGATNPVEHDKYIYQSSSYLTLNKDEYYYIELNHKEGSYSEHFSIFWKTPFTQDDTWKRIPDFYIYDYECEIACIPQGTPCDDGDPFTNNDMYDANCDCIGTPCSGANCDDPLASYSPYPKCGLTDQLDNREDNNWLSCTASSNPNASRPVSHWIEYDFGHNYFLYTSQVWNYNESTGFNQGFESVAIDYSIDGTNWTELGTYNWSLADGSTDYSGFIGPDFGGIEARYVLITSLDGTSEPNCRGFGKLLINAEHCPNVGATCDDGDPLTIGDVINEFCICEGFANIYNNCDIDTLQLGDTLIVMDVHSAIDLVESANTIGGNSPVMFVSGKEIDLNPGFETTLGSNFEAFIELCNQAAQDEEEEEQATITKSKKPQDLLTIKSIPDSDIQIIEFYLDKPGKVDLTIMDKLGNPQFTIVSHEFINKGLYQKRIRTKRLIDGVYQVLYKADGIKEIEKLTVI